MSLFIKQIADNLAGQVAFSLPYMDEQGSASYKEVIAFLSEDPVIKLGNKWESLIPDLGSINEFTQLAGIGQSSWISTSKMSWKGTDPITVNLNFYLITYLKEQVDGKTSKRGVDPISKQATYFARLAAITSDANGGILGTRVNVHGGYKPNYFQDNNNNFLNNSNIATLKAGNYSTLSDDDNDTHTCHIVINGNGKPSVVLRNMLLESLDMTPSTVRAGYWDINYSARENTGKISSVGSFQESSEPLYIKVNAGFRLAQVATTEVVEQLFGGRYNG